MMPSLNADQASPQVVARYQPNIEEGVGEAGCKVKCRLGVWVWNVLYSIRSPTTNY